ncbi:MAG: hypothetical protein KYX68_10345 [Flavobacterium sp.]|nr:hypothetical protein [Flavobacterium sp.]
MINFETSGIRQMNIDMFNLKNLNDEYIFFYDETNNIRRYYLKEDGFNESVKTNFILGGLLHKEGLEIDLEPLFKEFKLQDNIIEVKLKHLASGDFEDCLKSEKISILLNFINESELYLHFSSLNFLYFSIVDIVDSLIEATNSKINFFENRALKNDLYVLIKNNQKDFIPFLYNLDYPNIKEDRVDEFVDLFIEKISLFKLNQRLRIIIDLLEKSKNTKNLFFIMNEENHTLINDFSTFYSRTTYLFINSKHKFDKEDSIEPLLNGLNMTFKGMKLSNYEFIDSNSNLFIQASDIIIGLIGKYYSFINQNTVYEIEDKIKKFNSIQTKNLNLFIEIIYKSDSYNKAFIHQTISDEDMAKFGFILSLRGKV